MCMFARSQSRLPHPRLFSIISLFFLFFLSCQVRYSALFLTRPGSPHQTEPQVPGQRLDPPPPGYDDSAESDAKKGSTPFLACTPPRQEPPVPTLTANKLNSNTNRHSRPHASTSPQHPSTRHQPAPRRVVEAPSCPPPNNDLRPDDAFSQLWYPIVIEHNLCVSLKSECLGLPCATVQSVHYMLQLHGSDRCSRLSLRQGLPVAIRAR